MVFEFKGTKLIHIFDKYNFTFRASDTSGKFNDLGTTNSVSSRNTGIFARKSLFMDSTNKKYKEFPIHFMGRLHNDFSGSTNSLLIPGVDVFLDLELLEPNVFLMSNTHSTDIPYTYEVSDIKIHIPVASMSQDCLLYTSPSPRDS